MRSNYIPGIIKQVVGTIKSVASAVTYVVDRMQPQPQVLEDWQPQPTRKRTSFSDNITASLALPDTPQKVKPRTKNVVDSNDENSTYKIVQYFNAIWYKAAAEKYQPNIPIYKDNIPIKKKMESLEVKIKERVEKNESIDDLRTEEVELVWEQIIEHAQRRADVFFYLLITVYKKFVILNKDDTVKQHGKGCPLCGTNACHCSLFPNIKLVPMPSQLIPPFLSAKRPLVCPLLDGTHFGETLNMTEELPRVVNVFDMHLEGKVHNPSTQVRRLTNILNKVSVGLMTPKEGMDSFYQIMNKFFQDFELKDHKKVATDTPRAIQKVAEYQYEGTFKGANKNHNAIKDEYLYLLLRMKASDIKWIENTPSIASNYLKKKTLEKYYLTLQQEIYSSHPVKKPRKKPNKPRTKKQDEQSDLDSDYVPSYKL